MSTPELRVTRLTISKNAYTASTAATRASGSRLLKSFRLHPQTFFILHHLVRSFAVSNHLSSTILLVVPESTLNPPTYCSLLPASINDVGVIEFPMFGVVSGEWILRRSWLLDITHRNEFRHASKSTIKNCSAEIHQPEECGDEDITGSYPPHIQASGFRIQILKSRER
jgi:hypothetical protein